MKNLQLFIITIAALTLMVSCKAKHEEENPIGEPDIIPVKIARVSTLGVPDQITATGLVSTEDEAKYAFKIGGVINRILVQEGQFFKQGQLLATLNSTEISAGLAQSSLGVEKAQRDYNRALNLYKDSVYTLEQLQNTKTALDVAQKAREATAFNERYSKIYASSDGFVSKKIANEGEVIAGGMPVLLTNSTEQRNSYSLKVGVTDREWAIIKAGQTAKVTLDGYAGQIFDATVFRKSQAADRELGSFQIELKLQLNGVKPAVGMFGKAEIATHQDESVMVIPYASLVEADGNKGFVFTTIGTNRVKRIPVTILKFDNENVYLKDKLEGIDQIVVSNSAYLNEQSIIKIIK
ncbi:efflux RND transporter periplasmic adaptor subunit [Mucilaginibacter sp. KACC 22063]|uniref:efflux RND transporter periplasmic adaptor subunit n=1 Tax=Mucilaginibacter sp. KACC 22063 TaxID=3025666 RepID=UPI0023670011|nr:efflux RND transporter periplasmic adaptor subunit [Mucilaginibacter sp. KACC 22063]WDF55862.1 efflux RND transporter periplasmic adaptor subunit [Mucilaginibacter sp. KACC 22063]